MVASNCLLCHAARFDGELVVGLGNEFLDFTDDRTKRNRRKQDILMASWFPQVAIRRWTKEQIAEMSYEYAPSFSSFSGSGLSQAPW